MATNRQPDWLDAEEYQDDNAWRDAQRRLEHQVELQSQQIERLLARHEVPAGVSGGSVRPHWVSFDLAAQLSGGLERLRRLTGEVTGEIASALGVPEVRLERQNGGLRLAVRRYEAHPVDLLDLLDLVPEVGDLSLALGLDHQGQPVLLNLNQRDLQNILVAGISGAGKSSLMRSIAISLALSCRQSQVQLAVIGLGSAPSGITSRPNPLYPVNYLPHLLFPVATEVDEAIEALAYLVEEVAYRADNGIQSPALIILVDDADMLLRRAGGAVANQLASLLHAPAEAGVRVIVGASNAALPDLWQMLQHNVDLRLVGRMADERSAQAASGIEESYAEYLDGKGDFIAISAAGIQPFQAAYIDDYDLHLTLTELHRASAPVLLAQKLGEPPSLPPTWSDRGAQGFTYDSSQARATMTASGGPGLKTIEIAVDPVDAWQRNRTQPNWLADEEPGVAGGGLSLPLVGSAEPDVSDAREANSSRDTEAQVVGPASDMDEDDQNDGSVASTASQTSPITKDEARVAPQPPEATDEADGGQDEGGYEMLPFDDGQTGGAADIGRAHEKNGVSRKPITADKGGPDRLTEQDSGLQGQQLTIMPGQERTQTLWPVEPIYTDIDDDLWDVPDADDDDWRKRLH